jgi:hypothetical protein
LVLVVDRHNPIMPQDRCMVQAVEKSRGARMLEIHIGHFDFNHAECGSERVRGHANDASMEVEFEPQAIARSGRIIAAL